MMTPEEVLYTTKCISADLGAHLWVRSLWTNTLEFCDFFLMKYFISIEVIRLGIQTIIYKIYKPNLNLYAFRTNMTSTIRQACPQHFCAFLTLLEYEIWCSKKRSKFQWSKERNILIQELKSIVCIKGQRHCLFR